MAGGHFPVSWADTELCGGVLAHRPEECCAPLPGWSRPNSPHPPLCALDDELQGDLGNHVLKVQMALQRRPSTTHQVGFIVLEPRRGQGLPVTAASIP